MASAITSMKTGMRTLESLPSAGNMTLVAKFPLTYPAADCPPVFQFIASDPVINEVTLSKILRVSRLYYCFQIVQIWVESTLMLIQ